MKRAGMMLAATLSLVISIILFGSVASYADIAHISDVACLVYSVEPQNEEITADQPEPVEILTDRSAQNITVYVDGEYAKDVSSSYTDMTYGRLWTVNITFAGYGKHTVTAYASNTFGAMGHNSCSVTLKEPEPEPEPEPDPDPDPEPGNMSIISPEKGDNLLYSHDDGRYINFDLDIDSATLSKTAKIAVTVKDKDSGDVIIDGAKYELNKEKKSISVKFSKFFPWLKFNYPLDPEDIDILTEGKRFEVTASAVDADGSVINSLDESLSFTISYPEFNAGTKEFSLDGLGMNKYHTDCYTACFTHTKVLKWTKYAGRNVKYIVNLTVDGKTVVDNRETEKNSFDLSEYYDKSDKDKEYVLTVGVFSDDLPYEGKLNSNAPNVFKAKFVYEAHPSKPVISKASVEYDAFTCKVSGCSNIYQARIVLKDSDKKVLYKNYQGEKLKAGTYYASAYIDRFNCSEVSDEVSFKVKQSDVDMYKVISDAVDIIIAQEGGYTTVVKKDVNAVSLGKICWHAENAHMLLCNILDANPAELKANLEGSTIYEELLGSRSAWARRVLDDNEKDILKKALATDNSKKVQDAMADEFVEDYISYGISKGIEDEGMLIYFADLCNQGGKGGANSVLKTLGGDFSLDNLHKAALASGTFGPYAPRRNRVYKAITKTYGYEK